MIKLWIDLQIKELSKALDLLQPNNNIGFEVYTELNKTFARRGDGIIETKEFKNGDMKVQFIPHEVNEYGGLYRLKSFTLVVDIELPDYDRVIKVLHGLKTPF